MDESDLPAKMRAWEHEVGGGLAGHEARAADLLERGASEIERLRGCQAAVWQTFDYANPPESGLYWLEIERPEKDGDVDDSGRTVGWHTGRTHRLVVLAEVHSTEEGPAFERVHGGEHGEVRDDDAVLRFMPLTPPVAAVPEIPQE